MYDVAIIGSGPAGISAALDLKLHNKSIIFFGSDDLSKKVTLAEKIANYPGVPMVSGSALNELFRQQLAEMGIEITDEMVTNIAKTKKGFMVLGGNDIYEARTVLLAVGSSSAKGFTGEDEFLGRGVSYCATCDGFLYKNKTIAVFCADNRFEHEIKYLSELAEKLYLFTSYKTEMTQTEKILMPQGRIREITGGIRAEAVVLENGERIEVDGVFIMRNSVSPALLLRGIELSGTEIAVDRSMKTSVDGCFAAGDCTGRPYQIAKAVGEGNIAAHSILEYLSACE